MVPPRLSALLVTRKRRVVFPVTDTRCDAIRRGQRTSVEQCGPPART